jgi:hypothetical protein
VLRVQRWLFGVIPGVFLKPVTDATDAQDVLTSVTSSEQELQTERRLRAAFRVVLGVVLLALIVVAWHSRAIGDRVESQRWEGPTSQRQPVEATTRAGRLTSFASALVVTCQGDPPEVLDFRPATSQLIQSGSYVQAFVEGRLRSGATVTVSLSVLTGAAVTGNLHAAGGDGLGPAAATCKGDVSFRLSPAA